MRILVTGAGGFVGSHLVPRLLSEGHAVRAIVRSKGRPPPSVEAVAGDVRDEMLLRNAMEGCEAVVHLAAVLREDGGSFTGINVGGTTAVVRACSAAKVSRLIHMSAEGARPDNPSRFLRSKAEAEEVVRSSGLRWTILRPSLILGRGSGFGVRMARAVRGRRRVPIIGRGNNMVQPVHVDDVCSAVLHCLSDPRSEGRVVGIGGPTRIPLGELTIAVARAAGSSGRPMHIPVPIARVAARALDLVSSNPPVTPDEVTMMSQPNVCDNVAAAALDIHPTLDLGRMVQDSVEAPWP